MLHRHAGPAVAGSYLFGAIGGALTTTSVLVLASGLLSPLPAEWRGVAAICVLALLALHASRLLCLDWLPQRRYQIPRETFMTTPSLAAFRFAFELGTGVRTYVTATAPYAAAALVLLTLPASLGAATLAAGALGLGYGVGRSLIVAIQSLRSFVAVEHPQQWLRAADLLAIALALAVAIRFIAEHG